MKCLLFVLALFTLSASTVLAQAAKDSTPITIKTRSGAVQVNEGMTKVAPTAIAQDPTPEVPDQVTIQAPATVTIDYNDPDSLYSQGLVGLLTASVLAILGVLGKFIPGLRSIAAGVKGGKFISSGVVIFISVIALATFKEGAFTKGFVNFIMAEFLPKIGYAGTIYGTFSVLINWIKGRKKDKPATQDA